MFTTEARRHRELVENDPAEIALFMAVLSAAFGRRFLAGEGRDVVPCWVKIGFEGTTCSLEPSFKQRVRRSFLLS